MFAIAGTTILSFVIVGVLAADEELTTGIDKRPVPFTTSCDLKVVSSGCCSGESFNGDVTFLAGSQELLQVGLHPEMGGGSLAIRNDVFKRGKSKWGYQWVEKIAGYSNHGEDMRREYSFEFKDTELRVLSQGEVLISIPYNELTSDKDQFLSDIDTVIFGMDNIRLKFGKVCQGTIKPIPTLILYDYQNQQGTKVTLLGPTPNFGKLSFNDKTTSVWAVNEDWELYTAYNYFGERFLAEAGQKVNARRSNSYSSARPANCRYLSDPTTAKIRVSSSSHFQYGMQEFLTPQKDLGEWKNKITSVIADKGDWELYKGGGFSGDRLVVKEGQQIEHTGNNGFSNNIVSLRPVCETYKGKEKCGLNKIEIVDTDAELEPRYTGTEIIGSQSSGSCYGPASHEIELTQVNGVEEAFSIETSREDEINWSVTASVQVETSAKFLGSGGAITMGVEAGIGGAHLTGKAETTEDVTSSEKGHGQVTEFDVPGAGILFGVVDRYEIDKTSVPVKMYMTCPDGRNKTLDSTMAMKQVSFGAAHFWSLTGQFTKEACEANRNLPDCVENVRKNFANFVGQKSAIEDAFEKCFAGGKGEFKRV